MVRNTMLSPILETGHHGRRRVDLKGGKSEAIDQLPMMEQESKEPDADYASPAPTELDREQLKLQVPKEKELCPSKVLGRNMLYQSRASDQSHEHSESSGEEENEFVVLVPAAVGSLADALNLLVDAAKHSAPIREKGQKPPPIQCHHGTTFLGIDDVAEKHTDDVDDNSIFSECSLELQGSSDDDGDSTIENNSHSTLSHPASRARMGWDGTDASACNYSVESAFSDSHLYSENALLHDSISTAGGFHHDISFRAKFVDCSVRSCVSIESDFNPDSERYTLAG